MPHNNDEYVLVRNDELIALDDDDDEHRNARTRRGRRLPARRPGYHPMGRTSYTVRPSSRPPVMEGSGRLSTGQLVEAGAQVLAALKPLPPAPTASGRADDDVRALIEYQGLLAQHAKQDEQLRTIGSLAAKFFA